MSSSRVTAQFLSMLGSRICANLLQAVNVIVLARSVSPGEIGVTSSIIGVCMVLFTVTDLGVSTFITKAFAQGDRAATASALSITTFTTWFFGAVFLAAAVGLGEIGLIPLVLTPLVLSVAVDRCVEYRLGVPIAAESLRIPAVSILLRRGTQFAVFLAFVAADMAPLAGYALAQLLGALAGYAHSRWFLHRLIPERAVPRLSPFVILRRSFHYFVNNVATQIQLLDTFLVSWISGAHNGGLYAAAWRVTNPLILIPGTLASAVLPPAARATPQRAARIGMNLTLLLPVVLLVSVPGGFLLSTEVCRLLYGAAYEGAGMTLAVLLQGIPFAILAAALSAILQAQGDERFVARTGVLFAVAFVAAVSLGAFWYGAVGAAAGGAATFAAKCVPLVVRTARLRTRARADPRVGQDPDGMKPAQQNSTTGGDAYGDR